MAITGCQEFKARYSAPEYLQVNNNKSLYLGTAHHHICRKGRQREYLKMQRTEIFICRQQLY